MVGTDETTELWRPPEQSFVSYRDYMENKYFVEVRHCFDSRIRRPRFKSSHHVLCYLIV